MKVARRAVVFAGIATLGTLTGTACANDGAERADSSAAESAAVVQPAETSKSVAAVPAAGPAAAVAAGGVSVVTGVYTVAQAARGLEVYTASCALCHTMAQHSGGGFAAAWNGRRVVDLYEIIRGTMPLDNPGGLSDQEYIDVVAYMLQLNGVPPGKTALPADAAALRDLRIEVKPSAGSD